MLGVVGQLFHAAAFRLVDGLLHGRCYLLGVEDNAAVHVARGAASRLRERAGRAQEALLISIEHRHKRHFGQIQTLAQQVHAHEHAVNAPPQVFHNLHALQSVHVAVDISRGDAVFQKIVREFFRHALGQGRYQDALVGLAGFRDFFHQVVDRVVGGAHLYGRVEQSRGTDHLFHNHALAFLQFVVGRRGTDVNHLLGHFVELVEGERAVVQGGWQAEAIVHERLLARAVAAVHGAYLRHADMALVDDDQKVLGEEVQEAIGARARRASVEVARVVLNAAAVPQLAYHFDVVLHALFQPFCFERLAAGLEVGDLRHEVVLNLPYGKFLCIFRGKEKIGGINLIFLKNINARAALGINLLDAVDFVAPVSDADNVVGVGKVDIHAVALDAEVARRGRHVVARIEAGHKAAQEFVEAQLPPYFQFDDVFVESRGIAHAVNARDGRNYHHVLAAREQRGGSGEAQFVDVLVDGKVFLDISIRGSDIGFGLIVIVVRNVILHRILGEKAFELAV